MTTEEIEKKPKLEKFFIIFPKMLTDNAWMVSLMQNYRETDNGKTMITFTSTNFSAPSESRTCELVLA